MNDNRPPISELMDNLEIKSIEYSSEKIKEETEKIIDESKDNLVRYFVQAFCYMKTLQRKDISMAGEIDQRIKQYLKLTKETFSDERVNPVLAVTDMLNQARFPLEYLKFKEGGNIYQEVLEGNVILPKSREIKNAEEFGYSKRYLIPGNVDYSEIVENGLPSWVSLTAEGRSGEEIQETEPRPSKYYPIAIEPIKKVTDITHGWGSMDGNKRYAKYQALQDSFRELRKLNFTGLTVKEYLLIQAYSLFLSRDGGIDEDCYCLLMGTKLENIRTGKISCPFAYFSKSDRPIDVAIGQEYNIFIHSSSTNSSNLPTMEPRFAINLSGFEDE